MPYRLASRGGRIGAALLAGWLLAAAPTAAQEPASCLPERLSLERLACMSWPELEALYRQAKPGVLPTGYARGRAVYSGDTKFIGPRSTMTRCLWHGKHVSATDCTLINQWLGIKAVKARVSHGTSWLDGQPSIIMDYRDTSWIWRDVRDEVREVAPGLYVGLMFRCRCQEPKLSMYFVLEMPQGCAP
jgi:hypothetical protein